MMCTNYVPPLASTYVILGGLFLLVSGTIISSLPNVSVIQLLTGKDSNNEHSYSEGGSSILERLSVREITFV